MDHSRAEESEITCPECGDSFIAQVWLIIDTAGRPDLVERIRAGTLHDHHCPHCGHQGSIDAPLLLYRPGEQPRLMLSPARGTTTEQDREQAAGLLGTVRASLGDEWNVAWVADGLPAVPRDLLPGVLSDDPESALHELGERIGRHTERLRDEDPEAYRELEEAAQQATEAMPLFRVLSQFVEAETWGGSRRVVEEHPELLSDDADLLLGQLAERARSRDDARAVGLFDEHRTLLRRCREVGVRQAFTERVEADGPPVPEEFREALRRAQEAQHRYRQVGDRGALDEAASAWESILTSPGLGETPERFQLAAWNDAGGVFLRRFWAQGVLHDLDRALVLWQQAVQGTPPDSPDLPGYLNNLGTGLSTRYARTGSLADLEESIRVYQQALTILDRSFLISTVAYKTGQQARWEGLVANTVAVHLDAGQAAQALTVAEGNKSRLLSAMIGREGLRPPAAVPDGLATQEQDCSLRLAELEAADLAPRVETGSGSAFSTLTDRRQVLDQLMPIWDRMASIDDPQVREFVALRRGDRPTWEELARLSAELGHETALLSLFTTGSRTLVFVLQAGWDEPQYVEADLSRDDLRYLYLANYQDEMLNRRVHRDADRPLTRRWQALGRPLLGRALPLLQGVKHVVVVPESVYHLLPLHALALNDAGETLLDRFTVSYIPALSLLSRLRARKPIEQLDAVVAGYTPADPSTPEGRRERAIILGEAQAVADRVGCNPILDRDATSLQIKAAVQGRALRLVHLSCHGRFQTDHPLESFVRLADGRFTARQWMGLRFRAQLVALSACQTGMSGSLGGDEMAGLSQALLYAGASSLVLTLWSVHDLTTALVMMDFYRRLLGSGGDQCADAASALRQAALALRDGALAPPTDGFDPSDPYYWAPFVFVGDWRQHSE